MPIISTFPSITGGGSSGGGGGSVNVYTAVISTSWEKSEETGVYSQQVAIEGISAEHTARVDHVYTGDETTGSYDTFVEEENQYLTYITNGYVETYDGGIVFYIFGEQNTVEIPIVVEIATGGNSSGGSTILSGAVRYDIRQTLTDEQKAQARQNIGAVSEVDVPQKGVDYWTEADQESIVQQVISALPIYQGEAVAE